MATPFVPATDCARVVMVWRQQGQICENVLHFQRVAGFADELDRANLLGEVRQWIVSFLITTQSAGVVLDHLSCTDIATPDGGSTDYYPTTEILGTKLASQLPMNVTVSVAFKTAKHGRSYRGRAYHVGLTMEDINGSTLIASAVANLALKYGGLLLPTFSTLGSTLVVVSKRHLGAWRTAAEVTPVVAIGVDPNLDSQRRRLPGRGK